MKEKITNDFNLFKLPMITVCILVDIMTLYLYDQTPLTIHYMCDLFILSNPYYRSKNSPIITKEIRDNDLFYYFIISTYKFYIYIKYGDPDQTGIATMTLCTQFSL